MEPPPVPSANDSSRADLRMRDAIRAAADPDGFVPFDRFMELALYADDVGYYRRAVSPFGPGGDYYTAPRVHPLFGRTIGHYLASVRERLRPGPVFRIVELGPGDGALAKEIVGSFARAEDEVEYVLVERSERLGAAALASVEPLARARSIRVRRIEALGELGPFEGVVIANELLDAQPARRYRWTGAQWNELGVRLEGDAVRFAELTRTRPIPGPPLPQPEEPGTVMEIAPAAEALVREVADHMVRGRAIFLDYGRDEESLWRGHPHGTLASLQGHRFVHDPLELPGTRDLSTFVNFTRVRASARAAGLEEVGYGSQAEALGRWGFQAAFEEALRTAGSSEDEVRLRLAAKNLLFGFEGFRVLELAILGEPLGPGRTK